MQATTDIEVSRSSNNLGEPLKAAATSGPSGYDCSAESDSFLATRQAGALPHPRGQGISDAEIVQPFAINAWNGSESFMDMRLDRDPGFLEANVKIWAQKPPNFHMKVRGSHRERRGMGSNKRHVTVTDFDVGVPLHGFLFRLPQPGQTVPPESFSFIRTVENHEKVSRGNFRATLRHMPNAGGQPSSEAAPKPTLEEWCHRYCAASSSGPKTFLVERRVQGLDIQRLQTNVTAIVRSTGYSGNVSITFESIGSEIEVLSSGKINQWRQLRWLRIVCYVTFLWIFTWPFLYFSTRRFQCVFVEWSFSRIRSDNLTEYVSLTEDQMLEVVGKALLNAIMTRSNEFLTQQDVANAQRYGAVSFDQVGAGNYQIYQPHNWGQGGWGGIAQVETTCVR